jgi:FkbM family methyltransferase
MAKYLTDDSRIYAFEPFPGNHRFFDGRDPRIILRKQALAERCDVVTFHVPAVVSEDSEWGRRGMAGYSSGGRIAPQGPGLNFEVEAVAGDEAVPDPTDIDFVKLDLEGGEVNALAGMSVVLSGAHFVWCEFKGQPDLLDDLVRREFILFDTEYLFFGAPDSGALDLFEVSRESMILSNGGTAWMGFRRTEWPDYFQRFSEYATRFKLVQTDLVCVNPSHLDAFTQMLAYL